MKKRIIFLLSPLIMLTSGASFIDSSSKATAVDQRVVDLVRRMTAEEKIGQMTQVTIDVILKERNGSMYPPQIDNNKLEEALLKHHVGSIINVSHAAYTLEQWHTIITAIQDIAVKKTRMGIPVIYGIDAIHGANYTYGSTIFPQHLSMAATWNKELVRQEGEITAMEVRASGIPWNFNPVLDIGRHPAWPRLFETYGEDVALASAMAQEYVRGLQGENMAQKEKVAACLKHFVGYSFSVSGKDRTQALLPERALREFFLPTFQAGIDAGAMSVMVNSSENDGIPLHSDSFLLNDVLRGEMGFEGFVVSDWEDVKRLHTRDRVAETPKEAVRLAVMSGIDMSMVPMDYSFYELLLELVKEGSVPMARIDEAVSRILKVKVMLGLFENPYPDKSLLAGFGKESSAEVCLQAARESITLLKNIQNTLPLKKGKKVLVTGPTAASLSVLNGGWTYTWQGDDESKYPNHKETVLAAIRSIAGEKNVTYVEGTSFDSPANIKKAVETMSAVDAAIVCVGEKAYCESPGNIDDLTLDKAQLTLVEELVKTGKPVILVLIQGRPRIINSVADQASAILTAFLPGMEGGRAIAEVLFGDVNPSGKLPVTYPRYPNALMTYDHKPIDVADVNRYAHQFPFGFGLSYTTFAYSDLAVNTELANPHPRVSISVKVRNTGTRQGKEVVQLYLTDLYGSVSRPVRQLKHFEKIDLGPGEERTVRFELDWHDFSFIGRDQKRIVEPGKFVVTVGELSKEFALQ